METVKLFYNDPFLTEFSATVLSCEEGKGGWKVVLDQTAFYPEGGGQPTDHGILGGVNVTDVHEKAGVITHTCSAPLEVGAVVTGNIDWARRFDHMQQHSGEHIISGILCELYHCDNVGFHLGADTVTIDYNAEISWEQALDAERRANEVIWSDIAVNISYPDKEALDALDYRSKKELSGQVRIVAFPGADCCACCGTHVLRAGQVGLVKVLSCQKFREGVRMEILCGNRAFRFLSNVYDQNRAVAQRLSVKPHETHAAVERLEDELAALKLRAAQLEEQVFFHIAEEYVEKEDVLLIREPMKPDSVRRLSDAIAHKCSGLSTVFAGADGEGYNYALVRGDGADINAFVKEMNKALNGRGGGRNGFAQGSVRCEAATIAAFFEK